MTVSNIIDEALEMERLSRDYYRRLSRGSLEGYAGEALKHLAEEEQKHIDILNNYRDSLGAAKTVALPHAAEYAETWQKFTQALEDVREAVRPHSEEVTVIQKGIDLEKRAYDLYQEAEKQADTENGKAVFAFLAAQEDRHRQYLEKLLDKVLRLTEEPPEARPKL